MKRKRTTHLAAILAAGLFLSAVAVTQARSLQVQVRETALRTKPSYLGSVTTTLSYGNSLEPLQRKGPWVEVKTADGGTGWVHESAVSRRRVTLHSGSEEAHAATSKDEIALAGRGFSSDVEEAYQKQNRDIDYTWVDRMEQFSVTAAQKAAFLREGGLSASKGGVR